MSNFQDKDNSACAETLQAELTVAHKNIDEHVWQCNEENFPNMARYKKSLEHVISVSEQMFSLNILFETLADIVTCSTVCSINP